MTRQTWCPSCRAGACGAHDYHADDAERPCTGKDDDGCATDPELGRCAACGYILHNIPQGTDTAHDELCCQMPDCTESPRCMGHYNAWLASVLIPVGDER